MHQICEQQSILTTYESASKFVFDPAKTLTKHVSSYIEVYLIKVLAVATAFSEGVHLYCEILSFYIYIWCTQPFFNSLLAEMRGAVVEWLEQLGYSAESRRIA